VTTDNIVIDGNGYTIQGPGIDLFQPWYAAFVLDDRSGVVIKNVRITNWVDCFRMGGSTDIMITENTIEGNWRGVDIEACSGCQVSKNVIINNNIAITLNGSIDCHISDNYVAFNKLGLTLISTATTVCRNTIENNDEWGIMLWGSDWGFIDNRIFHNNIIENGIQASDGQPLLNYWYNPDILEGNFWSDYEGLDDGSGVGKHAIADDGIGDTDIPHLGLDSYPFMEQDAWVVSIPASVSLTPKTLNLASQGQWMTATIQLPTEYNSNMIRTESIMMLIGDTNIAPAWSELQHWGVLVKFERIAVVDALDLCDFAQETGQFRIVPISLQGILSDGSHFSGLDSLRVID
jgi:parallel beta-helix repeat protein